MAVELQVLGWAVLLAAVQLLLYAALANRDLGTAWLVGPRDDTPAAELSPMTGRLQRAFDNHIEGLVLFAGAVLVVVAGGASSRLTEIAAIVYLVARIVYLPAYCSGIPRVRSAVWGVGFAATLVMLIAALA